MSTSRQVPMTASLLWPAVALLALYLLAPAEAAAQRGATQDTARRAPDTAAPGAEAPARGAAPDTVSAPVYYGWRSYNLHCARCHGEDVLGSTFAPNLMASLRSGRIDKAAYDRVMHGSLAERGMPAFDDLLTQEQMDQLYAYMEARAEGKVRPGRPVRAEQGER